jgi:glycosyltransferase involved in cell wall biosynthesis
MKIMHISESISSHAGGLQFTATGLASSFKAAGNKVLFVAGKDDGCLEAIDVNCLFLDKKGVLKLKYLSGLTTALNEFKPDIIVQHGLWSLFNYQITRWARNNKTDYIIVPHGMLDPYILNKNKFQKAIFLAMFQRKNLRNAKFIRVLNENENEHVKAIVNNKTIVAPNAIQELNPIKGVKKVNDQVCFLGRIDHKKGVLELCSAWKQLKMDGDIPQTSVLKIAGWASDKKYLNAFTSAIANEESIQYLGSAFSDDKVKLLSESGAFILPSKGEGLPTSVLEAWSCGALVIMTPECNFNKEVFFDRAIRTGSDIESIKSSLKEYFSIGNLERASIIEASCTYVKEYTWPKIGKKILLEMKR